MARQIGQKMRFDDTELELMKALFANNENLLFIIRKVMLQGELTEEERKVCVETMTPTVFALMEKTFLPNLDLDAPFFQLADAYIALTVDPKEVDPDKFWPMAKAKQLEIDYIRQQLDVLRNVDEHPEPTIGLAALTRNKLTKTNREEIYVNLMARNYLLSFVDSSLQQLKFLAGSKEETVEETKERLAKDSSK